MFLRCFFFSFSSLYLQDMFFRIESMFLFLIYLRPRQLTHFNLDEDKTKKNNNIYKIRNKYEQNVLTKMEYAVHSTLVAAVVQWCVKGANGERIQMKKEERTIWHLSLSLVDEPSLFNVSNATHYSKFFMNS